MEDEAFFAKARAMADQRIKDFTATEKTVINKLLGATPWMVDSNHPHTVEDEYQINGLVKKFLANPLNQEHKMKTALEDLRRTGRLPMPITKVIRPDGLMEAIQSKDCDSIRRLIIESSGLSRADAKQVATALCNMTTLDDDELRIDTSNDIVDMWFLRT